MKNFMLLLFLVPILSMAQVKTVSGTVTEEGTDFPLAGVEISVQTTGNSVLSDADGKYSIQAEEGEVLEFSDLNYKIFTAIVGQGNTINVSLVEGDQSLDEVVVIGYGTAKKADLTGAIASVTPEEITKTPTGQTMQAIQGKVAGVQINSYGSPGEGPEVNIRGVSSIFGSTQPLYVVNGMFYDNIDFLDPNQIETFTVMKDASSSAIYGVKAASGVIVITTKNGEFNQKPQITYSGYYGMQQANNVLQMANIEQFTNFALESGAPGEIQSIQNGIERFGRSRINPNVANVNTDWYKETLRVAPMLNQDLHIKGGSEKFNYALGGSYFFQDGILKMKNQYRRYNVDVQLTSKVNKWLDVGTNIIYSRSRKYNDEESAWRQIYFAVPALPVLDQNFTDADPTPYSDAKVLGYRNHQNPFALLDNSNLRGDRSRTTGNIFANFQIIPSKLSFKTAFNYDGITDENRIVYLPYFVTDSYQREVEDASITRSTYNKEYFIWDNYLTYENSWGKSDLTAMIGTSFRSDKTNNYWARGNVDPNGAFLRDNEKTWYLENTAVSTRTSGVDKNGIKSYYGNSYFGRLSYQYADKYIAYFTMRSEGSNRFKNTFINLPAVGVGWIASKESFMRNASWLNFLKFRAGWGRLANENVKENRPPSANSSPTVFNGSWVNGFTIDTFIDDVKWEYTEELNIGLSSNMFKNRLSLEFDYFDKKTPNLIIQVYPQVGSAQESSSFQNSGEVRNSGIELTLGWSDKIGSNWRYGINANFTTLKNEVTSTYTNEYILAGQDEFQQLYIKGSPMRSFYGYVIDGVYQNQEEVDNDPVAVAANSDEINVKPGYFKFRDLNGDGIIDGNDRQILGSPIPDFYYGGSLSLGFKSFDLSVAFYGQSGNKILNRNRGEVIWTQGANIDADLAKNRWHGEGTTNEYPSSEGYRNNWNQKMSKFWLSDGDFFRIQNINLAYTLRTYNLPEMKLYVTWDRPFLWTKDYNGMNPEVGIDGVDFQTYPTPSTFSMGYVIKF